MKKLYNISYKFFSLKRNYLFFMSAVLIYLIAICSEAVARAGGGDGYSGGGGGGYSGGSSSGNGGGGDGIGYLIYFLLRLTFQYPLIGIPLDIAVIFIAYTVFNDQTSRHVTRTIKKAHNFQASNSTNQALEAIKEKDPNFTQEQFIARCTKAFKQIQNSWANQNMTPVKAFVSDGIYTRFKAYLNMQQSSLIKNNLDEITVENCSLAAVESNRHFDTIHLRITASAIDYYSELKTKKLVYGSKNKKSFVEYWSFLRRPGTKTLTGNGLVEGYCPNCAAPLNISEKMTCTSCKAIINSGEYDWVLAEITQEDEFRGINSQDIPGINQIQQKDPAFNSQHIEDRASVMFWRCRESEFFANPDFLSKLAHPDFIEKNRHLFSPLPNKAHRFYMDAAIGSVDLLKLNLSTEPNGFDEACVKIRWSGHLEDKQLPSLLSPNYNASKLMQHEYTLIRKAKTFSSAKNILSSNHCAGCGAPETIDTKGTCSYCNSVLNDGSLDWVLSDIKTYIPTYIPEIAKEETVKDSLPEISKELNEQLIACAAAIMNADGHLDEKESKLIQEMAKKRNISSLELKSILTSVLTEGNMPNLPTNFQEAKHLIKAMIQMSLADGNIVYAERQLLKAMTTKLGYTDLDINMMIKKERAELFRASKQILKKR